MEDELRQEQEAEWLAQRIQEEQDNWDRYSDE